MAISQTTAAVDHPDTLSAECPAQAPRSKRPLPGWLMAVIVHTAVTLGQLLIWFTGRCSAARALGLARWITLKVEPLTRKRRQENLRAFFGDSRAPEHLQQIDQAHLTYLARMRAEVAGYCHTGPECLNHRVLLKGEEYLRETLTHRRGALLVSGHTATWWVAPAALAARGYPVTAIFTPIHFPRVEKALLELTQRYNVKLAFVGRDAYLAARNAIEKNEILYLTFDVAVRANRARAFAFGDAALQLDPGPAILAFRNKMPTLQAACVHLEDGRNSVSIYPPEATEYAPHLAAPDDLCRLWTERLEKEVRLHPEQWWPWGYVKLADKAAAQASLPAGSQSTPGLRLHSNR